MKKLIFTMIITLATIVCMPNVFADSTYGTVTDITKKTGDSLTNGQSTIETKGDTTTIRYSAATFQMLPEDNSASDGSRPGPAAWIGFQVTEPDGGNSKFNVTTPDNKTTLINASVYKDYVGITPDNLKKALLNGTPLTYKYSFDWNENGTNDQYVIIEIDPNEITLLSVDNKKEVWSPAIAKNILAANTENNPDTSDTNIFTKLGLIIICGLGFIISFKKILN